MSFRSGHLSFVSELFRFGDNKAAERGITRTINLPADARVPEIDWFAPPRPFLMRSKRNSVNKIQENAICRYPKINRARHCRSVYTRTPFHFPTFFLNGKEFRACVRAPRSVKRISERSRFSTVFFFLFFSFLFPHFCTHTLASVYFVRHFALFFLKGGLGNCVESYSGHDHQLKGNRIIID